jgi:tRNA-splicing ligase RtcB
MSISELKGAKNPIKLWVAVNEVESETLDQLRNVANLAPTFSHVAAMADVHSGKGCTIGSVIAMRGAIGPNFVGVDIGCGMDAIKTNLGGMKERVLQKIHDEIRERIPVGFNSHESVHKAVRELGLWKEFDQLNEQVHPLKERAMHQLGTLGGGNHFIELSLDADRNLWVMLHSGSRFIGKELAEVYVAKAINYCHENHIALPDRSLSYLVAGTPEFDGYMHDLKWAQSYAAANRERMMELILGLLEHMFPSLEVSERISCHHNYATEEVHFGEKVIVTRKGAINAEKGRMAIIPGAMGSKSYIVRGLGCAEAFNSAPHGAGRRMSRSKAKQKYRLQDVEETMKGIVCKLDKGVIDEVKYSYKSIEKVMENSKELVEPVYELDQIINIKG